MTSLIFLLLTLLIDARELSSFKGRSDEESKSMNDETLAFDPTSDPDGPIEAQKFSLTAHEIIQFENYPMEIHNVTTPDFFNLTIIRIPRPGGIPVYFLHGIICSCRDFLVQPGKTSLPFQLYDEGFDIWLGNLRGNSYSNVHLNYTRDDFLYWNYSNDAIIKYDNPTAIDYVLSQTGQPKLIWIGWSLGTYAFYGTMAIRPDLNEKIMQMVGLAPFVYQGNMTSPVGRLAFTSPLLPLESMMTHGAFIPDEALKIMELTLPVLCSPRLMLLNIGNKVCADFVSLLMGLNGNSTSRSVLPVAFGQWPNTISVFCMSQLMKTVTDPNFRFYDYGDSSKNMAAYDSIEPPKYQMSNIKAPIILYYGDSDALVTPMDVDRLALDLPCQPRRRNVKGFNHVDFVFGRHAPELYSYIVSDLLTVVKDSTLQTLCQK